MRKLEALIFLRHTMRTAGLPAPPALSNIVVGKRPAIRPQRPVRSAHNSKRHSRWSWLTGTPTFSFGSGVVLTVGPESGPRWTGQKRTHWMSGRGGKRTLQGLASAQPEVEVAYSTSACKVPVRIEGRQSSALSTS